VTVGDRLARWSPPIRARPGDSDHLAGRGQWVWFSPTLEDRAPTPVLLGEERSPKRRDLATLRSLTAPTPGTRTRFCPESSLRARLPWGNSSCFQREAALKRGYPGASPLLILQQRVVRLSRQIQHEAQPRFSRRRRIESHAVHPSHLTPSYRPTLPAVWHSGRKRRALQRN
jgi:hypothetical protein